MLYSWIEIIQFIYSFIHMCNQKNIEYFLGVQLCAQHCSDSEWYEWALIPLKLPSEMLQYNG